MAQIPTPDLAVPYAAPKQVKTIADVQPIAPKKGYIYISIMYPLDDVFRRDSLTSLPFRNEKGGARKMD